jgi:hypothetical protein
MGFGSRASNVLQPLIDQAKSEAVFYGKPTRKTLLELAEQRAIHSYRPSQVFAHYSKEEGREAKRLLVVNGLEHLTNCSPSRREATLVLIEAEKAILSDAMDEQLEVA